MEKIGIKIIVSILIGTILEWYDFALLGSMTPILSEIIFPSNEQYLSLLMTFGVFATGFLVRPIGGVIFGHIGDRAGRTTVLSNTVLLMVIPTTLIGFLPTYTSAGFIAPVALVVLRLIQGIASSGEYPGAICYMVEFAPRNKKGLWGSITVFGVIGGVFLSSLITTILSSALSASQMYAWGWRVSFLLGLPLGIVGYFLRYKIDDSKIFSELVKANKILKRPVTNVIKTKLLNVCIITSLFALSSITFYTNFVYVVTYLVRTQHVKFEVITRNNMIVTLLLVFFIPLFGYLSDKYSRKKLMLLGAGGLLVLSYPSFLAFSFGSMNYILFNQILLAIFLGIFAGPLAAIVAESFSTGNRYSGISLGLNLGASVFGGTAPLVATYLMHYSKNDVAPCFYLMFWAVVAFVTICFLKTEKNNVV